MHFPEKNLLFAVMHGRFSIFVVSIGGDLQRSMTPTDLNVFCPLIVCIFPNASYIFPLQHTFRFSLPVIKVMFQDCNGKNRIFAAVKDGHIFSVSLPDYWTKKKKYSIAFHLYVSLLLNGR